LSPVRKVRFQSTRPSERSGLPVTLGIENVAAELGNDHPSQKKDAGRQQTTKKQRLPAHYSSNTGWRALGDPGRSEYRGGTGRGRKRSGCLCSRGDWLFVLSRRRSAYRFSGRSCSRG